MAFELSAQEAMISNGSPLPCNTKKSQNLNQNHAHKNTGKYSIQNQFFNL